MPLNQSMDQENVVQLHNGFVVFLWIALTSHQAVILILK